jgi:hypothetical protein
MFTTRRFRLLCILAAVLSFTPTVSFGQAPSRRAPTSPLAPPVTIIVVDAPALPPEFALSASADEMPALGQLDVADVRPGLAYAPPPDYRRLTTGYRLLPSRPDPARFARLHIPTNPQPPRQSLTPQADRFNAAYWGLFTMWLVAQGFDYSTTWDAVARCPSCREANLVVRDPATAHPNGIVFIGVKTLAGVASVIAEAKGYGKVSRGLLWGGIAGSAVSVPLNTTVGRDGAEE